MWEKYFGCSLDFYRQLHERERRNKISFANESVRVGGKVTDAVLDEENILHTHEKEKKKNLGESQWDALGPPRRTGASIGVKDVASCILTPLIWL